MLFPLDKALSRSMERQHMLQMPHRQTLSAFKDSPGCLLGCEEVFVLLDMQTRLYC